MILKESKMKITLLWGENNVSTVSWIDNDVDDLLMLVVMPLDSSFCRIFFIS
jgi:hypothetical protein